MSLHTSYRHLSFNESTNWQDLPWLDYNQEVKIMQRQIVVAYLNKDFDLVKKLQWELINSMAGCAVAVTPK